MATTKIACPRCHAVLKSNQTPRIGKIIKCPGCGFGFPVTADMVPAVPASPLAASPLPVAVAVPVTANLPSAVAVAAPAAATAGTISPGRLSCVLGGILLWLGLGVGLGYYCFLANRSAADGGKGDSAAQKREKEKEKEPPLVTPPPEQQAKINEAVNRAVRYLKVTQEASGTWPSSIGHPVGCAGLPGLTLLECGVPANDPNVQKAANYIRDEMRKGGPGSRKTYELALAILFLDRLGDPKDEDLIRTLALRLISGQSPAGGWGYDCPALSTDEENQLYKVLQSSLYATKGAEGETLSTQVRNLPVLKEFKENMDVTPAGGEADNSNTQFATLALWVAGRHKVPMDRTTDLLLQRFRSHEKNGHWDYRYNPNRQNINFVSQEPTMTAAGLLGLAVGIGVKGGKGAADEPGVVNGFRVLGQAIADHKQTSNLYFLWSVERAAVLYQRKTIGGESRKGKGNGEDDAHAGQPQDWYAWGAAILLPTQKQDGSWQSSGVRYPTTPVIDTCFATLFLRQANLAKDLTSKLQRLAGQ